jgi:beta-glucanase (GH16 family)
MAGEYARRRVLRIAFVTLGTVAISSDDTRGVPVTEQTGPAVFNPDGSHTHVVRVPVPVTPVPTPKPYTFFDEFSGAAGTAPDPAKWAPQAGRGIWGTGEVENMINSLSTAYVDGNSNLVIACVSDGQGGFNSARLNSRFSGGFGTWVMRAQVPVALGAWPALWFMGNNGQWPHNGEVDLAEIYGPNVNGGQLQTTVHSSGSNGQPSYYANHATDGKFHVYQMTWTAGGFVFSLDGAEYLTVTESQFPAGQYPFNSNGGMYCILNVAAGGEGPGGAVPLADELPVRMLVDYVHFTAA